MAAPDRNLPDNCLARTLYSRCIASEDLEIPELDIITGDSIDYIIWQVAQKALEKPEQPSEIITADVSSLIATGQSLCASKITNRSFNYNLEQKSSGNVLFTWDLRNIRSSLPGSYGVSAISVQANNASGPLLNSSSIRSSVEFTPTSYPVTVNVSLRIITTCGQVELTSTISLSNPVEMGDKVVYMGLNDFTGQVVPDLTQNDYNEIVANEIKAVKDQVLLLEDNTQYAGPISQLDNRVSNLESTDIAATQFERETSSGGVQETVSLTDYLSKLNSMVLELKSELASSNQINSELQEQINRLQTAAQ